MKSGIKVCILLSSLLFPFIGGAYLAPQVYIEELKMEKPSSSYAPGDSITGTVTLFNDEPLVINDLHLAYQLEAKEVDGVPTELYDEKTNSEAHSLTPGQHSTISYEYVLPSSCQTENISSLCSYPPTKGNSILGNLSR